jgi:TPR repeat protein
MKAAYLTLFTLLLTLATTHARAEDTPLLIEAAPQNCQPLTDSPGLEENLQLCLRQGNLGHAEAQYQLGNYWYHNLLIEQDLEQALHWYEQASLQGHASAQYQLGLMFARGEGIPVNRAQAYVILKMSAINGSDQAFDASDLLQAHMSREELEQANDVLSQIFRRYLQHIQEKTLQDERTDGRTR